MFDYNEYRDEYNVTALVKQFWIQYPSESEKEAKFKYDLIDKKELVNHFLNIINSCEQNISKDSEEFFFGRIQYYEKVYKTPELLNKHILEFKSRISEFVFGDYCVYNRAKKASLQLGIKKNITEFIALHSFEFINNMSLNIDKLISITDFEKNVKDSMLNATLYKRYIKNIFESFDEIFGNTEEFDNIIKLLLKNKDIEAVDFGYQWCQVVEERNLEIKTLICVFSLILQNKKYYKIKPTDKLIVDLINAFFGTKISYSYYGRIRKSIVNYDEPYLTKDKDYISHFRYISNSK